MVNHAETDTRTEGLRAVSGVAVGVSDIVPLVVGPATHGVTRYALDIASTPAWQGSPVVSSLVEALAEPRPTHVHVTDRLFGSSPEEAADTLCMLAARLPLTVTLHDLPQSSDGPRNHPRRADAYARIVQAARGVVVSSEHERALLLDTCNGTCPPCPVAVVPLPIDPPQRPAGASAAGSAVAAGSAGSAGLRDLVVLGFLYPGKGHEEALAALHGLPPDVGLLALGRPSDGHEDLVAALRMHAGERRFAVTGYVPDAELRHHLWAAAVPVAPHQHLSASGSIATWISAGRRPLVPRSRYVEELAARCPGTLTVYDGPLAPAAARALADPASTWLGPDAVVGPTLADVGARYAELLARWHA